MAVALFAFIAWVIISVYFFVPKRLSTEEIILLFFLFTIITTNIFVILDFNLNLFSTIINRQSCLLVFGYTEI